MIISGSRNDQMFFLNTSVMSFVAIYPLDIGWYCLQILFKFR